MSIQLKPSLVDRTSKDKGSKGQPNYEDEFGSLWRINVLSIPTMKH